MLVRLQQQQTYKGKQAMNPDTRSRRHRVRRAANSYDPLRRGPLLFDVDAPAGREDMGTSGEAGPEKKQRTDGKQEHKT